MAHPAWCENLIEAGGLKKGERVLVVVDEPLLVEGSELAAAVKDAGGEPRLEIWGGERPLAEPPPQVLDGGRAADLSFFMSQAPRGDEAAARFRLMETVTGRGGRQIFMGFVDGDLLRDELSRPVSDVSSAAERLIAQLKDVETIRIRGRAGTDLTLRVGGRPWKTDAGDLEPGESANFPGGEIFVAPYADGADGVLVTDVTVPYTVEGRRAADLLRELVEGAGEGADVIAELGIGLNPSLTPRGHVMLDEKAGGTAHVAIGRNTGTYGGDNEAAIHVDLIFSEPVIEADGRPVDIP
jgi:leucyl aminopeptidase (aminopeptidase T)